MLHRIVAGAAEYNLYESLWLFFCYSILGWLAESIYMSICNKRITNRGFVHGPICPIYGLGAMMLYKLLSPFAGRYILLYIAGVILASTLEMCTAMIMLKVFGYLWWDYSHKPFNFHGILCLESSIVWGLYTIFEFAVLHKGLLRIIYGIPYRIGVVVLAGLTIYFLTDFAYCLIKAVHGEVEEDENNILKRASM